MTQRLVTIGIPTVNRLAYLIEAVESALGQTWPHIEVLVGHDGDGTDIPDWCRARASRDPRLRYHRNPRQLGFAGNWNAIATRATGEFLVLIGDDDRLLPAFVETLISAASPETAVVFCNHHVIDRSGRLLPEETSRITREYHRLGLAQGEVPCPAICAWQMAICPSAALMRRSDVVRLRFTDELNSPDIEYFVRLAGEGARFDFIVEYLVEFRVHGASAMAAGLRNEHLAARLLTITAPREAEPWKRALLGRLLVNAVSRRLARGEIAAARSLLKSEYYPASTRLFSSVAQRTCAALPALIGVPLYRSILRMKNAASA